MDAHARLEIGPIFKIKTIEEGAWSRISDTSDIALGGEGQAAGCGLWTQNIHVKKVFARGEVSLAQLHIEQDWMTCAGCGARLQTNLNPICTDACPVRALAYVKE
jgi:ferredoxin